MDRGAEGASRGDRIAHTALELGREAHTVKSMARSLTTLALTLAVACSTGQASEAESGNANVLAPPLGTATDAGATSGVPTFAIDIEPIMQAKCQSCHRAGGIAPFPLVTFEEVKRHGFDAKAKTASREMPPWGAFDAEDCKVTHPFLDDLRMTDEQIALVARWVDGGMPMGDESKRPAPRTTFPATSLEGGTRFQLPQPYTVQPGNDDLRCFPIDPGFTEDTWITTTNVVPGDARVVHHVVVYLDKNRKAPEKAGPDGSYKCFGGPGIGDGGVGTTLLLAWAPGVPPTGVGQTDAAIKIPKGAGLVMQVHYHPTNEPVVDRSSFEVLTLPPGKKPSHVAQVVLAGNARDAQGSNTGGIVKLLPGPSDPPEGPSFLIPSGATAHTESMDIVPAAIPVTLRLALAGAHMHWAGTNLKLTIERAAPADGQPPNECLLSTPKYDFNWQRGYSYDARYEDLPTLQSGDKLHLTCTYDNSPANKRVAKAMDEERVAKPFDLNLGETTHDEMCLAALVLVRDFVPGFD